jgi:hypothetical protein
MPSSLVDGCVPICRPNKTVSLVTLKQRVLHLTRAAGDIMPSSTNLEQPGGTMNKQVIGWVACWALTSFLMLHLITELLFTLPFSPQEGTYSP